MKYKNESRKRAANKKKQKVLLIAVIVCILAIISTGTLAYFIHIGTAYNVITTPTIDVRLMETTIDEHGNEIPFPIEGFTDLMPGAEVAKKVWVENVGSESVYIRIKVEKQFSPDDVKPLFVELGGLDKENWSYDGNYFYYMNPVEANEKTEPLFKSIVFTNNMPNEYQKHKVDVVIDVQAVQSKNNGATVFDAVGWPADK